MADSPVDPPVGEQSLGDKVGNIFGGDNESITLGGVEDFTRKLGSGVDPQQALTSVLNGAALDFLSGTQKKSYQSPQYAAELVDYAPKNKFLFKVKFYFNPGLVGFDGDGFTEFTYVIKTIDKPKVNFEYEEVNMYNFHTKVLRRVTHEPINMTFHDDIKNKVINFFNTYRTAYSPVSNIEKSTYNDSGASMEQAGMDFGKYWNSSNYGVLDGGNKNILSHIEVFQIFGHGSYQNKFTFINPKIDIFDFDDMDMEGATGNALTVSFLYDALHIEQDKVLKNPVENPGLKSDIVTNSDRKQFPGTTDYDPDLHEPKPEPAPGTPVVEEEKGLLGKIYDTAAGVAGSVLAGKAKATLNSKAAGSGVNPNLANMAGDQVSGVTSSASSNTFSSVGNSLFGD